MTYKISASTLEDKCYMVYKIISHISHRTTLWGNRQNQYLLGLFYSWECESLGTSSNLLKVRSQSECKQIFWLQNGYCTITLPCAPYLTSEVDTTSGSHNIFSHYGSINKLEISFSYWVTYSPGGPQGCPGATWSQRINLLDLPKDEICWEIWVNI